MTSVRLVFRVHAIFRMFQRGITEEEVRHVIETGEVIEKYLEDKPYPSQLILGWHDAKPLHVVVADNKESNETIVITAYVPASDQRENDFRR